MKLRPISILWFTNDTRKWPLSSGINTRPSVALIVLKICGSSLIVTMPNWNQPEQNSHGRKNEKEIRPTTRMGQQRKASSHRQEPVPQIQSRMSTLDDTGRHNSAYFRINFRVGCSHRLASVKCIWLPGSSERKMKERLASMEELMCLAH